MLGISTTSHENTKENGFEKLLKRMKSTNVIS